MLITGAGKGIGAALAQRLAAAGNYELVLVSRSPESLEDVATRCRRTVRVTAIAADLADPAAVDSLAPAIAEAEVLHAVVNNAGIGVFGSLEDLTVAEWDGQCNVNVRAAWLIARACLPALHRAGRGLIVNVGSELSLVGKPDRAAYIASKHALAGLTAGMRADLTHQGIHTCMVYPGHTDSSFRDHQPGDRPGALDPDVVAETIALAIDLYPRGVLTEVCVMPTKDDLTGPRTL
ncbi:SDR family NAD(P)-dependent oxidoreductase [Longispora urticae]